MRKLLFITLLLVNYSLLLSQHEADNWYFGYGIGLSFTSGSPIALPNGNSYSIESSSAISDTNGNLLFYTNADTVWDRNNNIMQNGTGLLNQAGSATQGALIVPAPEQQDIYYILHIAGFCNNDSLLYSIVDLSKNGGLGQVVKKNILLYSGNIDEKLGVVKHCNNKDFFIIISGSETANRADTNRFISFYANKYGINNTPIYSKRIDSPISNYSLDELCTGQMKISPDQNLIAYSTLSNCSIYRTDRSNGKVFFSEQIPFPDTSGYHGYGLEFSNNSNNLYCGNHRINMATKQITTFGEHFFSQMQLGPDNKIYFKNGHESTLNVPNYFVSFIDNADSTNNSTAFYRDSISTNGKNNSYGMPNFPSWYFHHNKGEFTHSGQCPNNNIQFNLIDSSAIDSVHWVFYDDNSTSTNLNPAHIYSSSGTYQVDAITFQNGIADTTTQCVSILGTTTGFLGADTTICSNSNLIIGATYPNTGHYFWNTGDTTSAIIITQSGEYILTINNECATYADTISINVQYCAPPNDTTTIVFIPNIFTPNGDNYNDAFSLKIQNIKELNYRIYNRWGLEMYSGTKEPANNTLQTILMWDGTYKGTEANDGTYCYIITTTSQSNKVQQFKGFIQLIK